MQKKTRIHHQHLMSGRGTTGTASIQRYIKEMNRQFYEETFSKKRLEKYFNRYPNDEGKAILHYHSNIEISEGFYHCLSIFEIAFRNSLNRELSKEFGSNWYLKFESIPGLKNLRNNINSAQKHIIKRNEILTDNKVVAELTLGFWVRLLNAEYELILWKPLRNAFPLLQKSKKQRKNISAPINRIRNFRNRVFHHEPVSWDFEKLDEIHKTILKVMYWLNADLPQITKKYDRVPKLIEKAKINYS